MFINRISDQVDFEGWHTEWLTTTTSRYVYTFVNTAVETSMYFTTSIRWAISHGMWAFHERIPVHFIQKNKDYTLKDVAGNIRVLCLCFEVEMDDDCAGGPKRYTMLLNV